jgi:hypothetical protein
LSGIRFTEYSDRVGGAPAEGLRRGQGIAAASLVLRGDGTHRVSLDGVVATMRQTDADM